MSRKIKIIVSVLLLVFIAVFVAGISLYFQRDLTTFEVMVVVAAALGGAATFISGLNDSYDLVGKLSERRSPEAQIKVTVSDEPI